MTSELAHTDLGANNYLLKKVATLSVIVEEQNETIKQLTETLNKIIDNA